MSYASARRLELRCRRAVAIGDAGDESAAAARRVDEIRSELQRLANGRDQERDPERDQERDQVEPAELVDDAFGMDELPIEAVNLFAEQCLLRRLVLDPLERARERDRQGETNDSCESSVKAFK